MSLEQTLIGMNKQDAINLIHSSGQTVRIAEEDGVSNMLAGDYVPGRLNLAIANGKVTGVTIG